MALLVGYVSDKTKKIPVRLAACIISLVICYTLGTLQYCIVAKQTAAYGIAVCVYPFIAVDIVKCAAAALIGSKIRELTA